MDFGTEKLKYFENKTQFILLNPDGTINGSCDTLIRLSQIKKSLFITEPFLEGIKDVLDGLSLNEEVSFPCIGQELLGKQGYFDLTFRKIEENSQIFIEWVIIDLTEYYKYLIPIQQERNELDIKGEFLQIQQKAITLEKKLLELQNSELKRVKRFKEEFFAQVSHEMRTPLNSIAGIADLLAAGDENTIAKTGKNQYLKDLKDTVNHLSAIVNDILDLSRFEAGKVEIENQVFNLKDTIDSICNSFAFSLSQKNIQLINKLDNKIPSFLEGDRQKLTQILFNIIGNAIKYTEAGTVSLSLKRVSVKANKIKIQFVIVDTGIGMNKRDVKDIYKPYSRASAAKDKMFEGTGLGMSIVKKFIDVMGGQIEIKSAKNKGTEVKFKLDFIITQLHVKDEDSSKILEYDFNYIRKVLVAEDDPIALRILSDSLITLGLEFKSVGSGEAILEELKYGYYDLLILDKQLPGINGLEVAKHIRNGEYIDFTKGIPVILITGEKIKRTPKYFSDVLSKPFYINQLGSSIENLDLKLTKSKLLNPRYLYEVTNNKSMLMIELMDVFIKEMPDNLKAMKEMAKESKFLELKQTLHRVISNVQYMGISGLDKLMEDLETELDLEPEKSPTVIDILHKLSEIEKLTKAGLRKLKLQKDKLLTTL